MQPVKIVITLISLIILAIAIGSNLSPIVTVVILSQPTVMLPIGVWLTMAIGLGLLSSVTIQLLVWLQRRTLTKKIRQLQSRLQDVGEDVFSYTAPSPKPSARDSNSQPNFTTPPVKPQPIDDAPKERLRQQYDWEDEPVVNAPAEWEDVPPPPRPESPKSPERSSYQPRQTFVEDDEIDERKGVYDADFRLIQPPYKAPIEVDDEDEDEDEYEYEYDEVDDRDPIPPPHSPKSTSINDGESEDWGFDFDETPTIPPPHF